jgi:hypothetical protein
MNLGRALADTLHDFGIGGYIFGCEADAFEITVWRSVQTSDGKSVAMFEDPETGEINDVCRVAETFDLHRTEG